MDLWDFSDAYSITFFVYSNEMYEFNGINNITEFNISLNNETYFNTHYDEAIDWIVPSDKYHSIQRWDYAYLEANETRILNSKTYPVLFEWYKQNGIDNIGFEDEQMFEKYLGPVGYIELLNIIIEVGKQLQEEYLEKKCGKKIPIIIQDYEFMDCVVEATQKVNINNEAKIFFETLKYSL